MPIKLIKGDLFSTSAEIIAHGCNARGAFGSGVAGQISKIFPIAREMYMHMHETQGLKLGDVIFVPTTDKGPPIVANMITQKNYGYDGKLYASYEAIRSCLQDVLEFASYEGYSVAMPRVGCGLAGADWNIVLKIIQKLSLAYPDVNVEIYSLEPSNDQ